MCNTQMGIDHEQPLNGECGENADWFDLSQKNTSTQNSSPIIYEGMGLSYWPTLPHYEIVNQQSFGNRKGVISSTHSNSQSVPLTFWPSMMTTSANFFAPSVIVPPSPALTVKGMSSKLEGTSSPRRTLTDNDRRRMCIYHQENPSVKQTDIGGKLYWTHLNSS